MAVITRTLKSAGGDYTLLSTWEASEQTNLVSAGDTHVLECDAITLNDNQAYIAGWTTDATHFVTIKAAVGQEHDGVSGNGFLVQKNLPPDDTVVRVIQDYTVVQDIEVECLGANSGTAAISAEGVGVEIRRVIAKGTSNGANAAKVVGTNTPLFENCLFINGGTACLSIPDSGDALIYNCTAVNGGTYGYQRIGALGTLPTIRNSVAYASGTGFNGSWHSNSSNNATGTGTAPGSNGINDVDACDFVNGTWQPDGDAALAGVGADLSGTFTTDITGATRSTWDIGAFIADAAQDIDILSVNPSSFGNGRTVVVGVSGMRTINVTLTLGGVTQTVTECTNSSVTFIADTSGLSLGNTDIIITPN